MNIFLTNKLYRLFLTSSTFGYLGRTLFDITFVIYATMFSNAQLAVTIVSVATTLPYLIAFVLGYFADKQPYKVASIMRVRFYQFILFIVFTLITLFQPSWWIFSGIVLVNVVSDILGGYGGYLSMSINTKLVVKDDLSTALGFQNAIYNSLSLLGKVLGVFVLGMINYNYSLFGLINALLFLAAFLIILIYKTKLKQQVGIFKINQTEQISIRQFIKETKDNLLILKQTRQMYQFVLLFSGMNLYSSALHGVFLLLLLNTPSLYFYNLGYTIAVIELVEVISMIIGGIIALPWYKNMNLKFNVFIEIVVFCLYMVNLIYCQNKFVLLSLLCVQGYLAGISNPKLDALILMSVPEDKQTSIFSIFSTIITLTVPLGTVVFLTIANVIGVMMTLYLLFIVVISLLIYSYFLKIENS